MILPFRRIFYPNKTYIVKYRDRAMKNQIFFFPGFFVDFFETLIKIGKGRN